jgi:putative MFS transporter
MNKPLQDRGAPLKSSYAPGYSRELTTSGERAPANALLAVGQVFETLPLTTEHLKSCLALFFVFVIEAWEMMIIVYTSPLIAQDFKLGAVAVGSLIGAIFVGMGIGAIIWGPIAGTIGRKKSIIYSLLLYGLVSAMSVFSPNYSTLYALRLLSGVVAAGMLVTTFPYYTELLPVRSRGTFTVYLAGGWPIGVLCALGATIWMTPMGWRWVLGLSSLAGLWSFVVAWLVPESPYWLAGMGRQDEAREVIHRLSRGKSVISPQQHLHVEEVTRGAWRDIFSGRVLSITLLQIAINFTFAWGYWGLQTWLPTLLKQRGLNLPQSYGFIAISALCMIPGYMSAAYLTGKLGRKKVMIAYAAMSAIAGYAFANTQTMGGLYASNFALAFFSLGAWGVWDTWVAEIYSTRLRTVGYSWAILAQRLANIAAPSVIGVLIAQGFSFNITTTFINLFTVATTVMVLFLPETEGRDLA